jgi:hypothetical protein
MYVRAIAWNAGVGTGVGAGSRGNLMNRRFAALALVAAVASCKNHRSKLDDWPSTSSSLSEDKVEEAKGIDAPPRRAPVTAVKLSPVIHELGAENVVPETIVIQLASAVIDKADVGSSTAKTRLRLTPEVPGSIRYSGVSELTFTPARPDVM